MKKALLKIYQAFAAALMVHLREANKRFQTFKQKQPAQMADLFGISA